MEGHPALLRLAELETLRELAKNGNSRLYLGLDRVSLNGTDSGKHDSCWKANRAFDSSRTGDPFIGPAILFLYNWSVA
ncbi:MAG: hypothetical protein R3C05_20240 [Pirellulaceae bacterium]